jgi:hypothetical protein
VPAPAVIPALVAYINTVVVKTLVVDPRTRDLDSVLARFHVVPCYNGITGNVVDTLGIFLQEFHFWVLGVGLFFWSDPCQ